VHCTALGLQSACFQQHEIASTWTLALPVGELSPNCLRGFRWNYCDGLSADLLLPKQRRPTT